LNPRIALASILTLMLMMAGTLAMAVDSTATKPPATTSPHGTAAKEGVPNPHAMPPGTTNPHAMPPGTPAASPPKPNVGPGWSLPPGQAPSVTRTEPGGPELKPGEKLKFKGVTLHVFHRVFKEFHDKVDAKMKQEFRIGDSEYTGSIVEFVPDFTLDLKTRKVTTRGQEPNNPAWRIIVRKNGAPMDTAWAFMDLQPHFGKNALLGFIATRATFDNHGAVTSRDSLARKLLQSEAK
jgi:hypothetical protein